MKNIAVNGRMLAPVESMNAEPLEFYARKRVGLYDTNAGTAVDICPAVRRFNDLESELNSCLIGMDEAIHTALLGLLSGDNVFLLSKPGAAKSTLAGLIGDAFGGGNHFFKKNFTPDMSMSDLYGPLSVEKINQGLYEREWAGIATCSYALLDEFYKGSSTIQNNCLEIIEEHTISLAHRRINVPLLGVISASNELVNANTVWNFSIPKMNPKSSTCSGQKAAMRTSAQGWILKRSSCFRLISTICQNKCRKRSTGRWLRSPGNSWRTGSVPVPAAVKCGQGLSLRNI